MSIAILLVAIVCIAFSLYNTIVTNNTENLRYSAALAWFTILIMDIIVLITRIYGNELLR